eukprot:g253.t1
MSSTSTLEQSANSASSNSFVTDLDAVCADLTAKCKVETDLTRMQDLANDLKNKHAEFEALKAKIQQAQEAENGEDKKKKKKKKKKKQGNVPDHVEPGAKRADGKPWVKSTLSLDERVERCLSVGIETIKEEELRALLSFKDHPVCYDGFEPSGRMHIAQGVLKAINVNKLTSAGCVFKFWVADFFAMLNHKMGGDLSKIRLVGEYMVEVWKACGMKMDNVQFLWASDEINKQPHAYWSRVMDVAMKNNLPRILRCCTIMGRKETDDMSASQIFYPCMQCADVFFLRADICQLGLDQRKVNMLAREYCDQAKIRFKPVIISHGMLPGLKKGQEKMSKSDPN